MDINVIRYLSNIGYTNIKIIKYIQLNDCSIIYPKGD